MSNEIQVLKEDLKKYEAEINFILLKMNWRLSEEQKRKDTSESLKRLIDTDKKRILSASKQLESLDIFMPNSYLHKVI